MMARAEETTKNEGEWAFLPTSNAQSIQDFADRTLSWRGLLLLREPEPLSCSVGVPAGELEGRPARVASSGETPPKLAAGTATLRAHTNWSNRG